MTLVLFSGPSAIEEHWKNARFRQPQIKLSHFTHTSRQNWLYIYIKLEAGEIYPPGNDHRSPLGHFWVSDFPAFRKGGICDRSLEALPPTPLEHALCISTHDNLYLSHKINCLIVVCTTCKPGEQHAQISNRNKTYISTHMDWCFSQI